MKSVRVRFAPSPTGYLHVGGARTLLFNWLYARKMSGKLILRIEDTDQQRSTRQSEEMILSDISRLGLTYDEGPSAGGPFVPYRQSERLEIYARYAKQLLNEGKAYPCFCSDEVITQKRAAALKMGKTPHYDGTCAHLSKAEVAAKYARGEKAGLRFRAPSKTYVLKDHVRGTVEFKEGMVGDFFITRSPRENERIIEEGVGFPVYNFCCVVDDYLMGISHVIRAEEHLSNTVRQMMLYEGLGWELPEFVHISLVLGSDKQKLSKRSGDVSVYEYLEKGYLPEALLNFLALLGWWPPQTLKPSSGHPEILTLDEMISSIDLDGFQKAPAVFDLQKLNWMNGYYLHHLPAQEVIQRATPFFEKAGLSLENRSPAWVQTLIEAIRGECQLLSDLPKAAALFFDSIPALEGDAKQLLTTPSAQKVVEAALAELEQMPEALSIADIEMLPKKVGQLTGEKGKGLFMPIRAAATGKTHGPELKHLMPLLGKKNVLHRMKEILRQAQAV